MILSTTDPSGAPAPEPSPPDLGPHYQILRFLGAGGMGRVYLARDTRHSRDVAIKVLATDRAELLGRERFLREITIAAGLSHPHIVPVFDSGEVDGQLYYVMPYVAGETLRQRLNREPMLPLPLVLTWAEELAEGLDAAHAQGIIHRDIKPENLLIQDGHLLIADFGLARAVDIAGGDRLTTHHVVLGTPAYMSPEQATGAQQLDGRSDVYSLACVIHEMLTGSPPFTGITPQVITARKLAEQYPRVSTVRPSVPENVDAALADALRAQPADRVMSGKALVTRLRLPAPSRTNRRLLLAAPLVLLAIIAALLLARRPAAAPTPVASRPKVMVDVLANRTGDPSHDAFGVMAEDWLTEGLQRTGAVDVVPTVTALAATRYVASQAGGGDPLRSLAAETGATLVVTGAIYQEADSLVIQAQLVDAGAGKVLGAVEPVRFRGKETGPALQLLRTRIMGLLALRLDDRAIAGDRPPVHESYLAFSEGLDAYTSGNYDSAYVAFTRAYEADTGFALPLMYASICLSNRGDFAGADSLVRILGAHRDALTIPDRYWLDHRTAELSGNDAASLEALRQAAVLSPGSKAAYNFAVQAIEAREVFAAESALRLLSPDVGAMRGWLPYWDVLADAQHAQGKHQAELLTAREALRRFPERLDAYIPITRALSALGRTNELEQLWGKATAAADTNHVALARMAYDIGSELVAHQDSAAAGPWFSRARDLLSRSTSNPGTRLLYAQALWRLGDFPAARQAATALPLKGSTRAEVLGLCGVLAAESGDPAEAERLLGLLAAESPPYSFGRSQYEAARIAVALGAPDRAAGLLQLALSRGLPYSDELHRDRLLATLRDRPIYASLSARSH